MVTGKRFVIDIDGVVTKQQKDISDYSLAVPNYTMIRAINALYDAGNHITFYTARGFVTGIDWREVTEKQFAEWGLKYHELIFGKPNADYYVDDKFLTFRKFLDMSEG